LNRITGRTFDCYIGIWKDGFDGGNSGIPLLAATISVETEIDDEGHYQ
jgi:hypothetical protein